MKIVILDISEIVGSEICVSALGGSKVHQVICQHIDDGERVCLSFASVSRLTTAFLNAAIGQLYGTFHHDELRTYLAPPIGTNARQRTQLKLVVDRAKTFFMNPEENRASFLRVVELDD